MLYYFNEQLLYIRGCFFPIKFKLPENPFSSDYSINQWPTEMCDLILNKANTISKRVYANAFMRHVYSNDSDSLITCEILFLRK